MSLTWYVDINVSGSWKGDGVRITRGTTGSASVADGDLATDWKRVESREGVE
jgi:hypothetical protein